MHCFELTFPEPHLAHLVLSRPAELNTMNPQFWRELHDVLTGIQREGRARALVISSTGKHFSAGMALDTFDGVLLDERTAESRAAIADQLSEMQSTFTLLEDLRIPVIAAIQGGCVGGAVDMVTACCLRYATKDAFFCVQEINIGMVADVGTLQRLPRLLPMALVKELAYTGRRLDAARASQWGLVNDVFDSQEAMLDAAMQCAREIASKPPVAIWGTKQVIHYAREHSVHDSLRQMGWVQGAIWSTANVREAVTAMKARRPGEFPELTPLRSFREL